MRRIWASASALEYSSTHGEADIRLDIYQYHLKAPNVGAPTRVKCEGC
jgi:hypothetical protein